MFRIQDQDNFIEIACEQETDDIPSRGDARLSVQVSSHGVAGNTGAWVLYADLQTFCTALVNLERTRRGKALLASISPGELSLKIYSTNLRGHLAIEGSLGRHLYFENKTHLHSVCFNFEFDPSELVRAITEEWIQKNASHPSR